MLKVGRDGDLKIIIPASDCGIVTGRKKTKTSDFGVSRREGHDSSRFYSRKLYGEPKGGAALEGAENAVPQMYIDRVLCKSSELLEELPNSCIHLAVTSPPYNVGKSYDQDWTPCTRPAPS